jgi:cytosine/adenosine deaminase-related metal-dependent hydrolase
VSYLASLGVLEARPMLVHMIEVSDAEWDLVAVSGATVAHCPRSNSLLQCERMALEKALERNIPVALGTDSLASSPSLDVRDEAAAAIALHEGFVPADVITGLLGNTTVF